MIEYQHINEENKQDLVASAGYLSIGCMLLYVVKQIISTPGGTDSMFILVGGLAVLIAFMFIIGFGALWEFLYGPRGVKR